MIILRKKTVVNVGVMTVSNTFIRILAVVYKLVQAKLMSAQELGRYQLVMSIYLCLISLSASGIPNATSRLCAIKKDSAGKKDVLASARKIAGYVSVFCAFLLIFLCVPISSIFIHDKTQFLLCILLVPAVCLGGYSACTYGYLHAMGKSTVTAVINGIEQIIKVIIGICLMVALRGSATAKTPLIALSLSSAIVFIVLEKMFPGGRSNKESIGEITKMSLPQTASRISTSVLHLATVSALPVALMKSGLDSTTAMERYGILTSMAYPVVYLPNTITGAMGVLLLPEVARITENRAKRKKTCLFAFMALLIGTAFSVLLLLFAPFGAEKFFNNADAGRYMICLIPSVISLGTAQMFSCALTGMGKTKITFALSVADGLLGLALTVLLAGKYGIYGFIFANCVQDVMALILNGIMFFKFTGGKNENNAVR